MENLETVFKPASQMKREEDNKIAALMKEAEDSVMIDALSQRVQSAWERNRNGKIDLSHRLKKCLHARRGEYSPSEKAAIAEQGMADPIYHKLTGTKSRAAAAWLRDIILPLTGNSWAIEPSPIPSLPPKINDTITKSIMESIREKSETGEMNPDEMIYMAHKTKEEALKLTKEYADKSASLVTKRIEDSMAEGGWHRAIEDMIEDFVTYPFAVIKGPYQQIRKSMKWEGDNLVVEEAPALSWRRVSPFDIFPSPYARNIQDGELIELIRFTYDTLYSMLGTEGANDEKIKLALAEFENGRLEGWAWSDFSDRNILFPNQFSVTDTFTIEALHYWGMAKGSDLIEWGYPVDKIKDPLKAYPINAIKVGPHIIYATINEHELGQRPYHSACWDAVPGSFAGIALPEQMEDFQKMVNAASRALASNMSISSGPQVVVLADMMAEGEAMSSMFPWKIWQAKSSMSGNSGKPVDFFQPNSNASELLAIIDKFEQKTDDATNVPRYTYGNERIGGAGSTASGLSMLMNSAAKGLRRASANISLNMIEPCVKQTWLKIMKESTDIAVKGDCVVIPKGAAAILIKESQQQAQREFLQLTGNPLDIEIVGKKNRAKLLSEVSKDLGLGEIKIEEDGGQDQALMQMQEQMQQLTAQLEQVTQESQMQIQQLTEALTKTEQASESQVQQAQSAIQKAEKEKIILKAKIDDLSNKMAVKEVDILKQKLEEERAKVESSNEVIKQQAKLEEAGVKLKLNLAKEKAEIEEATIKLERERRKLEELLRQARETPRQQETTEQPQQKEGDLANVIRQAVETLTESMRKPKVSKIGEISRNEKGLITGATATQEIVDG